MHCALLGLRCIFAKEFLVQVAVEGYTWSYTDVAVPGLGARCLGWRVPRSVGELKSVKNVLQEPTVHQ